MRVSKHALSRLDAYARDAKKYNDELKELLNPHLPPRFETSFIENIRQHLTDSHNIFRLFSELSRDLRNRRDVRVIILHPGTKNLPPSIAMYLSLLK